MIIDKIISDALDKYYSDDGFTEWLALVCEPPLAERFKTNPAKYLEPALYEYGWWLVHAKKQKPTDSA